MQQRRTPAVECEVVRIDVGSEDPLRLPLTHELRREIDQRPQVAPHYGNCLRVAIDGCPRHHPREVRFLRHHAQRGSSHAVELHEGVARGNQTLTKQTLDPRERPLMSRDEERLLVSKMIEEARALDPHPVGDFLHLGAHEPISREHRLRGLDDAIAGLIGRLLGGGRGAAGARHAPTYMSVGTRARGVVPLRVDWDPVALDARTAELTFAPWHPASRGRRFYERAQ